MLRRGVGVAMEARQAARHVDVRLRVNRRLKIPSL
jgi:hypothetical protein